MAGNVVCGIPPHEVFVVWHRVNSSCNKALILETEEVALEMLTKVSGRDGYVAGATVVVMATLKALPGQGLSF
jgi:hypothetical protein